MKYAKPEITLSANAAVVIQGAKDNTDIPDSVQPNPLQSVSAYQADE